MAHQTPTRWAALGAAILLAPLSQSLLADGVSPAGPGPVFVARPVPAANRPAQPGAGAAPNQQPGAVIIYLPPGTQPLDLQSLLAGAATPPAAVGPQPGPKPGQLAPARPSGPDLLPQPRLAAPAPAPGLPRGNGVPQSPPQWSPAAGQAANLVTNPPHVIAASATAPPPQADAAAPSAEPRQRALIPASSLPLKLNESESSRGFFEWPEGMRGKPAEPGPAPQSPIAKRTKAIFRAPQVPKPAHENVQAQPVAVETANPAARSRALFSQRDEAPIAPPAAQPTALVASTSAGPYAPEPPQIYSGSGEPIAQGPVFAVPAQPQPATPDPNLQPQAAQPRALFAKPIDDRPAILTVAEQILGPNVLPTNPGSQGAQTITSQPPGPSARPKSKALLPKSLFVRPKPGDAPEPDRIKKYLPTNYPHAAAANPGRGARQAVQPNTAPAAEGASARPVRSKALFPIKFFAHQSEPEPDMAEPAGDREPNQSPTLAAAKPVEGVPDIARPELKSMPAVAPGTSLETPIAGDSSSDNAVAASLPRDVKTNAESDWRPSKRRRKPATPQPAKESKTDGEAASKSKSTAASQAQSAPSEQLAGDAIVKIEQATKPTPAVIVPLAGPRPAAPTAVADHDQTSLQKARDIDTAVRRSSAIGPDKSEQSAAVATDMPPKRRPVIVRPEKQDEVKAKRSKPVRIIRGASDSQAGSAAEVGDDQQEAEPSTAVVSGRAKSAKSSRSTARGFDPNAVRSNPLR